MGRYHCRWVHGMAMAPIHSEYMVPDAYGDTNWSVNGLDSGLQPRGTVAGMVAQAVQLTLNFHHFHVKNQSLSS